MQKCFLPVASLLNRLNYTKKFALLWLMSLVAISVMVYSLFASLERVIEPSQRQLQGLALVKPISRTIQLVQQHRGISAALLGGNESLRDLRAAREPEVAGAFKAMEGTLPPGLASDEGYQSIKANWEELRKQGLHWTVAENFAAHTRLIKQIQLFEVSVADAYLLSLDAEIASYYLIDTAVTKLPHTLEHLGQIRAYGTGILAGRRISESQQVELKVMIGELEDTLGLLDINLEKVARYNPSIKKALLAASAGIADSSRQITGLVAADILTGRFATPPGAFLDLATAEIDKGYTQMYESLLPTAEALIRERIARAEKALYTSVGSALLLFLAGVYISFGIYYAIVGSIHTLVRAADTFAKGDLSQRVRLDTRDELSRIGDSFNRMADGFIALLEERKRADESLAKESYKNETLLRAASDGIHILNLDGNVVQVNDAFCRMLGYTAAELLTMNAAQWDTQFTPAQFKANLGALEGAMTFETRHRRRDGSFFDVELSIVKVDVGGQQLVYCASRDITERKRAEDALRKSKDLLHSVVETVPPRIFWKDRDSRYLGCNTRFAKDAGRSRPDELIGKTDFEMGWKDQAELYRADDKAVMESGNPKLDYEEPQTTPDGSTIWLRTSKVPLRDESSRVIGILGTYEDITERKRAERALIESQEKLHAVIETALDAVVQMDAAGIITGWNNQAEKIFGWSREEAAGRALSETIIPPRCREEYVNGLKHFLLTGEWPILNSRVEMLGMHRDGHEFPIELSITVIRTEGKYEFNAFISDITSRKNSDDLIWKQANFDTLTGLPNRRMFYDRLEQEIRKAHRAGLKVALLFIDLDKFKEVNDTIGHSMGDILLAETARRIGSCVRESDTVARLGGDEFTVILAGFDDTGSVERITERILQSIAKKFRLGEEIAYVSASIGITLYPNDATVIEDLMKNADQAMYTAKNQGRNRFSYFTQSMQQAAQTRLRLNKELRGALAANQFRVYFQPIVDLATGGIHKAEALIRWQHPELGMVSPAQFIPLAEETGLIVEIGDWVFRESARQVKRWRSLRDTGFQISVNVSPVQFHNAGSLYKIWSTYLRELELPEQSIVIEITEGLLLEADTNVTGKLREFHDMGVQVAIDDFGTGYSSLSYIKKFDIDYLKIDQSFVRDLSSDPNNLALSEAIIVMAHRLGLKVIAEGVETEEQRRLLADAGCDYAQGYLFSRPVPAEELEKLLKAASKV